MKMYPYALLLFGLIAPLQAAEQPTIHFQVTEMMEVASDLLEVEVNIQYKAQDAGAVSAEVNRVAQEIVSMAEAIAIGGVKVSSGGYQTWSQPYGKKSMGREEWVVRQTLKLETAVFDGLLSSLGDIQQAGGQIQGLKYVISPERKREIEDRLKVQAIARFKERASAYAAAAGEGPELWKLLELRVGQEMDEEPVMPMSRGMFAMESAQGVTAPAGSEMLAVTVSGSISLTAAKNATVEEVEKVVKKVGKKMIEAVVEAAETPAEMISDSTEESLPEGEDVSQ